MGRGEPLVQIDLADVLGVVHIQQHLQVPVPTDLGEVQHVDLFRQPGQGLSAQIVEVQTLDRGLVAALAYRA